MVIAKKYTLQKHFKGLPKATDFIVEEEELPSLKDEEFLAEAIYISVDPYLRVHEAILDLGTVVIGSQVAKIIETKSKKYPVGTYIVGDFGWRTHTIAKHVKPEEQNLFKLQWIIPDIGDLPLSLTIGMLGMTGNTAYFGFLEICKPKSGEVVVVSGAAGAIGSHVGQIAKIIGCKVIGITGSDEKGKWLVDELGFDYFVNYKDDEFKLKLKKCAPEGVDCYFDNVGGEISSTVITLMNDFGRISVCGSISVYNFDLNDGPKSTSVQYFMILKQLTMEGFIFLRWLNRWNEGITQNLKWINEGKLKYKETITHGFENIFTAFVEMLEGKNTGKAVVKI